MWDIDPAHDLAVDCRAGRTKVYIGQMQVIRLQCAPIAAESARVLHIILLQ